MSRILLITGLWPTPDRPQAGIFVKRRVGLDQSITVVAPTSYRGPMPLRYLRLAVRALRTSGRFDGIEAHPLFPTGLIGLFIARLRRIPLVTYAHGADVRETAIENPIYRRLARLVVRSSAAIVTNSVASQVFVRRLGGEAVVIPPGVDLDRFRPTARPSTRRALYLGGSDFQKGYDIAMAHADTIVGPGIRSIDPDDVAGLIAAHDVILVPSRSEAFGLVAAEAIASGRWVVARDVGGLAEVVEDGVTGTLVSKDDEFARALSSVPEYDPVEVAGRAARFSLQRSNDEMAAVWLRVLDRG